MLNDLIQKIICYPHAVDESTLNIAYYNPSLQIMTYYYV